jgi:hypothetical protein
VTISIEEGAAISPGTSLLFSLCWSELDYHYFLTSALPQTPPRLHPSIDPSIAPPVLRDSQPSSCAMHPCSPAASLSLHTHPGHRFASAAARLNSARRTSTVHCCHLSSPLESDRCPVSHPRHCYNVEIHICNLTRCQHAQQGWRQHHASMCDRQVAMIRG